MLFLRLVVMPLLQLLQYGKRFGKPVFIATTASQPLGYLAGLLLRSTPYNLESSGWTVRVTGSNGQRVPIDQAKWHFGLLVGLHDTLTGQLNGQTSKGDSFAHIASMLAAIAIEMAPMLSKVDPAAPAARALAIVPNVDHGAIEGTLEQITRLQRSLVVSSQEHAAATSQASAAQARRERDMEARYHAALANLQKQHTGEMGVMAAANQSAIRPLMAQLEAIKEELGVAASERNAIVEAGKEREQMIKQQALVVKIGKFNWINYEISLSKVDMQWEAHWKKLDTRFKRCMRLSDKFR